MMKIISGQYRSLAILQKMIESFVSDQIIKYLDDYAFISIDQSAYLKIHSTQTSLHRVIDDWLEQIHNNSLTGACLLDISKCFGSINHEILLKKLEMYGITGNELDWFSSYLKNRKQMVFFLTGLFRLSRSVQWGSSGFSAGTLVVFTIY